MSQANEENKISPTEGQQETGESGEEISSGGSGNEAKEKRAAEVGEKKLGEPMEGWEVIAYLREFYPALVPEIALKIMKIIEENEKVEGDKAVKQARTCPKCGPGVFLSQGQGRLYCGKCHYTEFQTK